MRWSRRHACFGEFADDPPGFRRLFLQKRLDAWRTRRDGGRRASLAPQDGSRRRDMRHPISSRPAATSIVVRGSGTDCITPNTPCDSSPGPAVK